MPPELAEDLEAGPEVSASEAAAIKDFHLGRETDEPAKEPEPETPAPKKAAGKRGLAAKLADRDLENERLRAENSAVLARLDEMNAKIAALEKPTSPAEELPNFEDPDPVKIVEWADKRAQKKVEEAQQAAKAEGSRALYLAEKRLHPDFDKLTGKWKAYIESDAALTQEVRASENPFATFYDIAKELEDAERARESGDEEDQVTARDQLSGPRPSEAATREQPQATIAGEARQLEKMFGTTIDPKKFAKHRKFGDDHRRARRTGR